MSTTRLQHDTHPLGIRRASRQTVAAPSWTPILGFYLLAYLLTWAVWGTQVAQQHGWLSFHIKEWFGYWGVPIAAFAVAGLTGGRAAMKDLVGRLVRWRVGGQWYAVAMLGPALLSLVTAVVFGRFGTVQVGAEASLGATALYFVTNMPFMLLTEETGWRGFALPRLQVRCNALTAAVIVGLLWAPWHAPLLLTAGGRLANYPFVAFVLFCVAESILATWIYNHTRGSVLLAALFHAASDAALVYAGLVSGTASLFWFTVGVWWLVALGVALWSGAARLSRQPLDPAVTAGRVEA